MSEKRILILRLRKKWWDQIKAGTKKVELRKQNDYWRKRLNNRKYDEIHLWLGYPNNTETDKLIIRKWNGYTIAPVLSEEFGPEPIGCFCIDVSQEVGQ